MMLLNENKIDIYSGSLMAATNEIAVLCIIGIKEILFNVRATHTRG